MMGASLWASSRRARGPPVNPVLNVNVDHRDAAAGRNADVRLRVCAPPPLDGGEVGRCVVEPVRRYGTPAVRRKRKTRQPSAANPIAFALKPPVRSALEARDRPAR